MAEDYFLAVEGSVTIPYAAHLPARLLGPICFGVVCVTLSLGLWPFHAPANEVTWAKKGVGLELGEFATVVSPEVLDASASDGTSIEILAEPKRRSGTLLSLYRKKTVLFRVQQSLEDLRLDLEKETGKDQHFYVGDAFLPSLKQKRTIFLSITSGAQGIRVYLDGKFAMKAPNFSIPAGALSGRLIVADSPGQSDSFQGKIRGVAIYNSELQPVDVVRHYETWTQIGRPDIRPSERNMALYLFDEGSGRIVHNRASSSDDLEIPEKYFVIDKIALDPIWREFNFSPGYWMGNLKNIIGFVPVGFFFYAYFLIAKPMRRAVLTTVAVGALISITIELFQAVLPTRDSGTTDIITNTFGTWLGVLLYRDAYIFAAKRLPDLGWLRQRCL